MEKPRTRVMLQPFGAAFVSQLHTSQLQQQQQQRYLHRIPIG